MDVLRKGNRQIRHKSVCIASPYNDPLHKRTYEVEESLSERLIAHIFYYTVVKWIELVAFSVEDWLILNNYETPMIPWWTRILCEHMRALREVQLVTWDELRLSDMWISWKNRYLRSDPESDLEAWDEFVKCLIRTCSPTVENFRWNLEQMKACLGSSLSQRWLIEKTTYPVG